MKKTVLTIIVIISILFTVISLLTSCKVEVDGETVVDVRRTRKNYDLKATHFEYNNHSYIIFRILQGAHNNVIHDPDCPCNKNKE